MTSTKVTKSEHVVEIQVDTQTYLFTPEQYAGLCEATRATPPDSIIFQSTITDEDVSGLSEGDIQTLIDELNESVFVACVEGGIY